MLMAGTRSVVNAGGSNSGNNGASAIDTAGLMAQIQQMMDAVATDFTTKLDALHHDMDLKYEFVNSRNGIGGTRQLQYGRMTKLDFPKFNGTDVKSWLYKCQQFFSVEDVDDVDKVKLASIHMSDSALVWHQQYEKLHDGVVDWLEYKTAVLARFDTEFEDPLSELKNLKYDSSVQKYHEKFEFLLNKVDMPEAHAISLFLGGLPQSIALPVRMFKPKSLSDTASLCKLQEATLAAQKVRQTPILPLPKAAVVSNIYGNKGGYVAARNPVNTLALPAKPNTVTTNPTRRYLSQKDFDDKRAKGLCFHCDQKFVPGHKCSGQAFALELIIDPDPQMELCLLEGGNEEYVLPEFTDGNETPQISLNALTGVVGYKTMRVIGHFGKQKIHILIDSGSTHNFVDLHKAKRLGCKISTVEPLQVSVADGNKLSSNSLCRGFTWSLNGETFTSDVMLLPLGGCDMVLGVQWLATLGDIVWNFSSLKMQFIYEGRVVSLRGSTRNPVQWLTGKQLSKHVSKQPANLSVMNVCVPAASVMSLSTTTESPPRQHDHKIPLRDDAAPVNIRPYKHPPALAWLC